MAADGFLLKNDKTSQLTKLEADSEIPIINSHFVKWYSESPDLFVVFNSKSMSKNNPLLVLGPYGSLCWRGVLAGWPIGHMRAEAQRIFGSDELLPFLHRLISLEFLLPIGRIKDHSPQPETITKEFQAPEIQFQLSHAAIPWYCLWEICTTCDLRCRTCYLPHCSSKGPDPQKALDIAQQIIDSGLFYVSIMGGEPLLRHDLETIIERLRINGVFVKLITNGQNLTFHRAKSLKSAGLNQIEISFDGLGMRNHESSPGSGTYQQAVQAIRHAREAKIQRIGIIWTVHSANLHDLEKLPFFLQKLNVEECYLSIFKKIGHRGASAPFDEISSDAINLIQRHLDIWRKDYPQLIIVLIPGGSCGRTSMVIGANGDIRLCPFQTHIAGNIFQDSLTDIWSSKVLNASEIMSSHTSLCTESTQLRGWPEWED